MQVILLERIGRLGQMGDIVNVKDGFARNYLLPQKKALRATKDNLAQFESQRAQLEANNLELKKEAEAVAGKLEGKTFVAIRSAGDTGQLYGSVSTRDLSDVVTEGGFTIDRRQVIFDKPIKSLGLHETKIALQLCTAGNLRTCLWTAELLREANQFERLLIATDTPTGSGIMPLGMLYTMAHLASLTDMPAERFVCAATGRNAPGASKSCGRSTKRGWNPSCDENAALIVSASVDGLRSHANE